MPSDSPNPPNSPDSDSVFGSVIYAYTRAQALADGVLVDLSKLAHEAGFRWPVAVTERLYHAYIVPSFDLVADGQSIDGRAWDLLTDLRYAVSSKPQSSELHFSVLFLMTPGHDPISIKLKAVCDHGDDGSPVVTVMLLDED